MTYDPSIHHRRSIRLRGYDYSQKGAYFVTICTRQRECLLGEWTDGEMRLNDYGEIVCQAWHSLSRHYHDVETDAFVVMPNHVHGVIMITDDAVGAGFKPAPTTPAARRHGLSEVVRGFKTFSARPINQSRCTPGAPVWQRNFYEHIIRGEESLNRIRQYVLDNPARWAVDPENPQAETPEPQEVWKPPS